MTVGRWLLLAFAAAAVTTAPSAAADPSELERLRAEKAKLEARIKQLEAENDSLKRESSAPLAAALQQAAVASVQVSFDEKAGVTTIATTPTRIARVDGDEARQWITFRAVHPGRSRGAPVERVQFVVETAASRGTYRSTKTMRLAVDGTPQELVVVDYKAAPIVSGRTNAKVGERETVVVEMPASTLTRISEARDVSGTLGGTAFRLTPEQLAAVRAFRQRVES